MTTDCCFGPVKPRVRTAGNVPSCRRLVWLLSRSGFLFFFRKYDYLRSELWRRLLEQFACCRPSQVFRKFRISDRSAWPNQRSGFLVSCVCTPRCPAIRRSLPSDFLPPYPEALCSSFRTRTGRRLWDYFLRPIGRGPSPSDHLSKKRKLRMMRKRATGACIRRHLLRACRREEQR